MRNSRRVAVLVGLVLLATQGCGGGGGGGRSTPPPPPAWACYGGDAQHTAISAVGARDLVRSRWSRPVDLAPQYTGDTLYIHYGSPVITASNTVIIPVKTGALDGFRVDAVRGATGDSLWSFPTDYVLPPHSWTPALNTCLTPAGRLYVPAAGGTMLFRDAPDVAGDAPTGRVAFFGDALYATGNNATAFASTVFVNTPPTPDAAGNVYFGVQVTGTNPAGLESSVVKLGSDGSATVASVTGFASDMTKVQHGCAPALSADGATLYVTVNATDGTGSSAGWLVALRTSDLSLRGKVRLKDPRSGADAIVEDASTASPTIGPDGDVYVGVLENPFPANNDRGWLLHFSGSLLTTKTPAAFGWDDTASIVPATAVPGYAGPSTYLLAIKYNNYAGAGGDGVNRLAVVDPSVSAIESVSGFTAMKEILTVAGVTPDAGARPTWPNAVREWCINTAAVSPATRSILCNSEDGRCYRWNLVTNALEQGITLAPPTGEAYTPTVIGPDGTVYAINNAVLHALGD